MKVKVENTGPCRKTLLVEVPSEKVQASYERVASMFASESKLPGYRKGKAPKVLVERRFAKPIMEEVRDTLIGETYDAALTDKKIEPLMLLEISDVSISLGAPLKYKAIIDVPPQFKLPKYKKLSIKLKEIKVTDEQVEQNLHWLLEANTEYRPVENRPVQKGDLVQLEYEATQDGKPVASGGLGIYGKGRGVWIDPQWPDFIPGMKESLIGMRKGEKKEISASFPPDFKHARLAGQTVVYPVALKAIREKITLPIDEQFLKKVNAESEQALRARLRNDLEKQAAFEEKKRIKDEIVEELLENTLLDLPESIVQDEALRILKLLVREHARRGATVEEVNDKQDELKELATKSAEDRLKLSFILHRIAEEEEIVVDQAELDRVVEELAVRYGLDNETMKTELEIKGGMDSIRGDLLCEKSLDFILENAGAKEEGFLGKVMKLTQRRQAEVAPQADT